LKRPKHKDHLGALYTSDKNYSLRDYSVKGGQETSKAGDKAQKNTGGEDDENKEDQGNKLTETVPNPPSFYYNDIEKWNAKF